MQLMHELAAPFTFEGTNVKKDTLCLLVHGFTGSPAHLLELGQAINRDGYSVKSILLPGHGTTPEEMEKTNHDDWYKCIEDAYLSAKNEYSKVNIISLSMGALATMVLLGKHHGANKFITMSAPICFRNPLVKFTPIIKYFKRFNEIVPPPVQEGENGEKDIGYLKTPVKCVKYMLKLSKMARKSLPQITTPIMVIQSHIDGQVLPESGQIIFDGVSSEIKKILWLENSKHIVPLGLERKFIFQEIIKFLNE